eukprot:TRINITY_DN16379_c0_g1_i1.p1 TRINITY_DN16379_c0_g1~~TRINITY_DN16379_c0_g1_i1.p1  ORF type:complete len:186 (+),score=22.30 TRINITY_DN16379_c0_g1_i1:42-560(+)
MTEPEPASLHDFSVKDIDGHLVRLRDLCEGKLTLVTNVASHCAKTDRSYKAMARLHDKYSPHLAILAFPCNQFAGQEPGPPSAIKELVRGTYSAKFSLFDVVQVKGPNTHPLFRFLLQRLPGPIPWNFGAKFLCDFKGIPFRRFDGSDNWADIDTFVGDHLQRTTPHNPSPL